MSQVFPNKNIPLNLAFKYMKKLGLMVHFQRFALWVCFLFPMEKDAQTKPNLEGSFLQIKVCSKEGGICGNQVVNFVFSYRIEKKKYM